MDMNNVLLINSTCDLILLLGTAMCCIMVGYEIGSHKKTHIVWGIEDTRMLKMQKLHLLMLTI